VTVLAAQPDPFDVRRARQATGLLAEFNDVGVLAPSDVHVAQRLAALAGESDEAVMLAVALAVRAPRVANVYVDLANVRETAAVESDETVDLSTLPWPSSTIWVKRVAASGLVTVGEADDAESRPLRLLGSWLYLDRYWREEREIAADLLARSAQRSEDVQIDILSDGSSLCWMSRRWPPDRRYRSSR